MSRQTLSNHTSASTSAAGGVETVTEWFREPPVWPVIGDYFQGLRRPVTVWSAACSTGQEAYSIAIMLEENNIPGRVLASDCDPALIEVARRGRPRRSGEQRRVVVL